MEIREIYNMFIDKFWEEPHETILRFFRYIEEYDYKESLVNPKHVPLASNWTWKEMTDYYKPDQLYTIYKICEESSKIINEVKDKFLHEWISIAMARSYNNRYTREDIYDVTLSKLILSEELIIQNLLQHQDIIYNPVVLLNNRMGTVYNILFLTKEFIYKCWFLSKTRYSLWWKIDTYKYNTQSKPIVYRWDIIWIDWRIYPTYIWYMIQQNNFNF